MSDKQQSIGRGKLGDAIGGVVSLLAGAFIVTFSCYYLGLFQEPVFGYGALADSAFVAVIALVGTTAFAALLGVFLMTFLKWRYGHRIAVLEGGERE